MIHDIVAKSVKHGLKMSPSSVMEIMTMHFMQILKKKQTYKNGKVFPNKYLAGC